LEERELTGCGDPQVVREVATEEVQKTLTLIWRFCTDSALNVFPPLVDR
jgi:hypothetical protein